LFALYKSKEGTTSIDWKDTPYPTERIIQNGQIGSYSCKIIGLETQKFTFTTKQ
jgi:hypothetical protein